MQLAILLSTPPEPNQPAISLYGVSGPNVIFSQSQNYPAQKGEQLQGVACPFGLDGLRGLSTSTRRVIGFLTAGPDRGSWVVVVVLIGALLRRFLVSA
ncbi:hypothetical protein VTL71DRAFT_1251 [Oculimacula yallundae]|uniref:Uncharacterized protein n=1 Tax=Oculimacula yallundae TaxID=86028 RepID=A0ABR4CBC3_9HELO